MKNFEEKFGLKEDELGKILGGLTEGLTEDGSQRAMGCTICETCLFGCTGSCSSCNNSCAGCEICTFCVGVAFVVVK
jgi:hypothetical protein